MYRRKKPRGKKYRRKESDGMINLQEHRKKMEYVDNCELLTPEEVARLFKEYTDLIWDDFMIGKIYDFYDDDIVMNHANGLTIQGVANVFANTLSAIADKMHSRPGYKGVFVDIFAEGDPENGYRFLQATTGYDSATEEYPVREGIVVNQSRNGSIGLCECLVKKVNGRWQIIQEWLVRASGSQPD